MQTIIAMLITDDKVTEIFFIADEFYSFFDRLKKKHTIEASLKR